MASVHSVGHVFHKKTTLKSGYCHHCTDLTWVASWQCKICRFIAHEKCINDVKSPCAAVASSLVKNPVAHWWGPPKKFKKKHCNVCRKRLDDRVGCRCEVCRYYVHQACKEFSVPDCKRCASFNPNIAPGEPIVQFHHWREGNISASSKCAVCNKTCGTTECLASLRCAWCCAVVHSGCSQFYDISCDFGAMRRLVLPPACVSMPNTGLSAAGVTLGMQAEGGSESGAEDCVDELDKTIDLDSSAIRIYDGNSSRPYRTVHLSPSSTVKDMLAAALQEYLVPVVESAKYVLAVEQDGNTCRILSDESEAVGGLRQANKIYPPIIIRAKDGNLADSVLRVYPGLLKAAAAFVTLVVTPVMTADDVVGMTLKKYGLTDVERKDYCLVEMNLFDGVKERIVDSQEKPWAILQAHRSVSVRQVTWTRFYLRSRQETTNVLIYVGALPQQAQADHYWDIMRKALGPTIYEQVQEGPVFPQFGSLFMTVSSSEMALQACVLLKTTVQIDQKPLVVMILPDIHTANIDPQSSPVLLLVNERSGGGQGSDLLTTFRRLLNPHQVFNIAHGGPLPGLYAFRNVQNYRLVVCGGDGSVGWVLSVLDEITDLCKCPSPALAVLPLGTGNDLARVLRWGGGYHGEAAFSMLQGIEEADEVSIDRWTVRFSALDQEPSQLISIAESQSTLEASKLGSTLSLAAQVSEQGLVMNNYFGVGIDADISLGFHLRREEAPEKFTSRLHNKGVYVKMSLNKMVQRSGKLSKDLPKSLTLECDGQPVKLPSGLEGVVVLNIQSWAAGCDAWGSDRDERFKAASPSDGLIEVVGVNGVMHMGQIQGGMRTGIRLAQGSVVTFTFHTPFPVQIDGEPWLQPACRCRIEQCSSTTMLRRTRKRAERSSIRDREHHD